MAENAIQCMNVSHTGHRSEGRYQLRKATPCGAEVSNSWLGGSREGIESIEFCLKEKPPHVSETAVEVVGMNYATCPQYLFLESRNTVRFLCGCWIILTEIDTRKERE